MEILFQKSFHQGWQSMLRQAAQDVGKFDRSIFNDPALAGMLQKIAAKYDIQVARLEGETTARRRVEEREGRDAWGDHRKLKITWLDVSIPFVGEGECFRVAPSRCAIPNYRATIGNQSLTISIVDDDRADVVVEDFKKIVSSNLQQLQSEYEQVKPQLEQAIQRAVDQRKAQIATEDTRDKGRSFRVLN